MRRFITMILIISVFCSPLISSVYAGQIQSQQFSQEEAQTISQMEADSASEVASIAGGDDVKTAMIILLAVVIYAVAANV